MKTWLLRSLLVAGVGLLLTVPWMLHQTSVVEKAPLPAFESVVPPPVKPSSNAPKVVYKWQDKEGAWHYADQPPAGHDWETLTVNPGEATTPAKSLPAPAQPPSQTVRQSPADELFAPPKQSPPLTEIVEEVPFAYKPAPPQASRSPWRELN